MTNVVIFINLFLTDVFISVGPFHAKALILSKFFFFLNPINMYKNFSGKKSVLHQSEMIHFTSEILKYSLKCSIKTFLTGFFKLLILQKMAMFPLKYSSVMSSENWPSVCAVELQ